MASLSIRECHLPADDSGFGSATRKFERRLLHLFVPAFRRALGSRLVYKLAWSDAEKTVVDFNQNAGCAVFGHYPEAALEALEHVLLHRLPMRLPLAHSSAEQELRTRLLDLAAPALSGADPYECIMGMRSGAEALDTALSIALLAPRHGEAHRIVLHDSPPTRLMLIVLRGSFHGNATRASFSASAVFRAHPQAAALCEYDAYYLSPDASAHDIDAAFAPHDSRAAACVAVVFEACQHFAALTAISGATAGLLAEAAAVRGVPTIADEIWSGVYRTGDFLAVQAITASGSLAGDEVSDGEDANSPSSRPRGANGGLRPDMVVMGKGLSASICKHSAVLVRSSLLPLALVPRPVEPCTLCCAVATACLDSVGAEDVRARGAALGRLMRRLGHDAKAWLRPVVGVGYSYELELVATHAVRSGAVAAIANAVVMLYLLLYQGVLLLPRPLRLPRRFHAELSLGATDDDVRLLFGALRAASVVATAVSTLLIPIGWGLALFGRRPSPPADAHASTRQSADPVSHPHAVAPPAPMGVGAPRARPACLAPAAVATLDAVGRCEARHRSQLQQRRQLPIFIHASGELLYTGPSGTGADDGSAPPPAVPIVDCCADRSSSVLGHHPPAVAAAFRRFVDARAPPMPFGLLFMKPTAQALTVALETAVAATWRDLQDGPAPVASEVAAVEARRSWRSRLMLSTVDANEAAVRLCLLRWELERERMMRRGARDGVRTQDDRPILLVLDGCDHGQSWMLRGLPVSGMAVGVLPRGMVEEEGRAASLRETLEACMLDRPDGRRQCAVAALMVEPVSSQSGRTIALRAATVLRELCTDFGVRIISDETRAGLGRCGGLLGGPSLGLRADATTLGESLGAGYASVSAVIYDTRAFLPVKAFPSTATMANDNLGSHVGLAVLSELSRRSAWIHRVATQFESDFRSALDAHRSVCTVNGRGLMLAVTLAPDAATGLQDAAVVVGSSRGRFTTVQPDAEKLPPGLLLHLYLASAHGVRVRPSASDDHTVVVELAAVAQSSSVERVCTAFTQLASLLAERRFEDVIMEANGLSAGVPKT